MIDRVLIKDRLSMIAEFYQELELLKEIPQAEFLEKRNSAAAESFLRRSLEAVFDVGRHILAKTGHLDLTREYRSIALGLGEKMVVSEELSATLVEMAGYRNRLVHLYHLVSSEELYGIVRNKIGDLQEFVRQVNLFLKYKK